MSSSVLVFSLFLLTAPDEPASSGVNVNEVVTPAPAFLGVQMASADDRKGVIIAQLIPGGSAEKSGVRSGDVITEINGQVIAAATDVIDIVAKHQAGDTLALKISRDEKEVELLCVLRPRPLPSSFLIRRDPPRMDAGTTAFAGTIEGSLDTGGNFVVTGTPTITGDATFRWTCLFDIGIRRAEKSYVRAAGNVKLDGLLYVHVEDEKVRAGDRFEIVSNAKSVSGKFAELMLPKLDDGLVWQLEYDNLESGHDVDGDGKADVTLIVSEK